MRRITLDILSAAEKDIIAADITDLISDPSYRRRIILGKKTEGTYTPGTGLTGDTWTRDAIFGARGSFTVEELQGASGVIELGDIYFLIKRDDYLVDLDSELEAGDQLLEYTYSTGHASVVKNSTAVDGSGTSWSKQAHKGDFFRLEHEEFYYEINTVTDGDHIVLKTAYARETKARQPYQILRRWNIVNVQISTLDIIRKIHCRRVQ